MFVIVTLEDGTTYNIDTIDCFKASNIVEYKLRQKSDYRTIKTVELIKGATIDKYGDYYNSSNQFDSKDLKCTSGKAYSWD